MPYKYNKDFEVPRPYIMFTLESLFHNGLTIEEIMVNGNHNIQGLKFAELNAAVLEEIKQYAKEFKPEKGLHTFEFSTGSKVEFYIL